MKNSKYYIIAIILCSIIFGIFGYYCGSKPPKIEKIDTVTVTDTFWKDTTIVEKELVPKIIVKKKVDTVYSKDGDTLQLITESKTFEKRLISGKDTADVKVFTTGINTSLDSLKMRLKTHNEIVTNTVEVTKYVEKKKTFWDRFHISLQGGYGYAFKSKELTPYAGVGGSFDL
jgi:hypothetical protein